MKSKCIALLAYIDFNNTEWIKSNFEIAIVWWGATSISIQICANTSMVNYIKYLMVIRHFALSYQRKTNQFGQIQKEFLKLFELYPNLFVCGEFLSHGDSVNWCEMWNRMYIFRSFASRFFSVFTVFSLPILIRRTHSLSQNQTSNALQT